MIPVLINNRNRLTWLEAMVKDVQRIGGLPVILDNASTYRPLLDWYADIVSRPGGPLLIPLLRNGGARGLWVDERVRKRVEEAVYDAYRYRIDSAPFVYTDPDLDLSGLPVDTLDTFRRIHEQVKERVGCALEIEDLPEHYPLRKLVQKIEGPYWKNARLRIYREEFPEPACVFDAPVDTTFAYYPKLENWTYEAIRVAGPYKVRHLPWYGNPKNPTEEERYYALHCEMAVHSNICPEREDSVSVGIAALKARYRQ